MVDSAQPPNAEQALRRFLQQYQNADEKAEFQRLVFGMYAALDVACGQALSPRLGVSASKLNFSQKVQALLPDDGDVQAQAAALLPRLNHYRRSAGTFSEEHVRATATGFVGLALRLWDELFGTPPPAVEQPLTPSTSDPGRRSGRSPDLQAPAQPVVPRPRRTAGSTGLPWPAILFALALIVIIAWIGGFLRPQTAIRRATSTPARPVVVTEPTATPTIAPTATPESTSTPLPPTATPTAISPTATPQPTSTSPPPTATPGPTATLPPTPTAAPPTPTPVPPTPPPPVPGQKFQIGDIVQVQTAGPGLNTRLGPGLAQEVVFSFEDETELTVVGGPQAVDGLTWWEVTGLNVRGWSAENFLELVVE